MSGLSIRLNLWLKLWFTSVHAIVVMLLFPLAVYFIYSSLSVRMGSLTSMIYEKTATLLYVIIMQWCFSIDFDSKFYGQLITYPISRWKLIVERWLVSTLIFIGLLCFVTMLLTPFAGSFIWKGLLFAIPVYIGLGGIVVLAAVIGNHSLGGFFAGLVFWMLSLYGGTLSLYVNPVLLEFPHVFEYVSGTSDLLSIDNHWILYNRVSYIGLGVVLSALAILHFNRKSI